MPCWELDVFGGARRAVEAAQSGPGRPRVARRAIGEVTLTAEIATDYVSLRADAGLSSRLAAQQKKASRTRWRFGGERGA